MAFGLNNSDQLDPQTADALNQLMGPLNLWAYQQHDQNGAHTDITCDSVDIGTGKIGVPVSLPFDSSRFYINPVIGSTWTVTSAEQILLQYIPFGPIAMVRIQIASSTLSGVTPPDSVFVFIPELFTSEVNLTFGLPISGYGEWSQTAGSPGNRALTPCSCRPSTRTITAGQPASAGIELRSMTPDLGQPEFTIGTGFNISAFCFILLTAGNKPQAIFS